MRWHGGGSARQAWTARSHALVVLCLMVLVVGLLIAPSARRRIVEQREGTTSINRGRGGTVKSCKQAIAIGLSEPRKKGNRSASTKKQPEHFKADFRCDGNVADRRDRLGPRDRTRLSFFASWSSLLAFSSRLALVAASSSRGRERRASIGAGEARSRAASRPSRSGFPSPEKRAIGQRQPKSSLSISRQIFDAMARWRIGATGLDREIARVIVLWPWWRRAHQINASSPI